MLPNFDVYDVAQRMLLTYENLRTDASSFKLVNKTLMDCKEMNLKKPGIPNRQYALWTLGCLINAKKDDEDYISAPSKKERIGRWFVSLNADAALEWLHKIIGCPRDMALLAMMQLDAEYRHDGVRKAHKAGKIEKERVELILSKNKIPTYSDYLKTTLDAKIKKVLKDDKSLKE